MDLLVPQMARLLSVENATRLFLLLSQLLIVGGALVLERVVKGRVHLSGFAALMFLYCLPFTWGFVNFEFGLGVALWAIAAYLAVVERPLPVRFVVNTVFVAVLFAAHFFALGIYGATLGIYELWRARDRKVRYRNAALRLAVLALPVVVLFGVMRLTAGSIGSEGTIWHLEFKPVWLLRIMNGYNLTVSAASALGLMALLYVAARRGVLKLEPAGIWLAIGFALLYLAIPSKLFGTSFADLRMNSRGSFDHSGLLLAVAAQPTMDNRCPHCRHRHYACQSGFGICGLAVLPRGLCFCRRVVPQD